MDPADTALVDDSTATGPARRQSPFGSPHVFLLAVIAGQDTRAAHRIVRPETLIGRAEGAHFILEDERISKAHCKIRVEGSVCTIMDLGSRNGTSVNGRRLLPDVAHRLRHLDEIELGKHRLLLVTGRFRDKPQNKIS
jgi:pSer/pThr/pTyr-binding forkhead associated (FHA) protein